MENIFNLLTSALHESFYVALIAGLGWGMISILFSPCHLTSVPLIIGYISKEETIKGKVHSRRAFVLSLTFALGILFSIALIGLITSSMGRIMGDIGVWGNYFVAAIFILVALYLLDIISINWNSPILAAKSGLWGALFLGIIFGIGLGPCTFSYMAPVLGIVFTLSKTSLTKSMLLVAAYGIGHCSIIVAAGTAGQFVQKYLNWDSKTNITNYVRKASGLLVFLGGIYFIYISF